MVVVGFARPVLPALREVGHDAVVVVPTGSAVPADDAVHAVCEVDLHGPVEPVVESVEAALAGRRAAAVVALAERTVVVAAALRSALGLAGNTAETALACADKVVMKRVMESAGVPVTRWREVGARTAAPELVRALGLPLVLKPRRDSGGRQQEKLGDLASVEGALERIASAPEPGYGWLAEAWLDGVEMSVETFVAQGRALFSSSTEYLVPRHANIVPAPLADADWGEVRAFARGAVAALGVRSGITHLELFRTRDGAVFGELASRPPGGRIMTLMKRAWGFDPWEAVLRLELGHAVAFPDEARRYAGVWVLHPGPGRLLALEGVDEARATPGVRRITLKVRPGDTIPERHGAGQDVGAVYSEGPTRDAVARSLERAAETMVFRLG